MNDIIIGRLFIFLAIEIIINLIVFSYYKGMNKWETGIKVYFRYLLKTHLYGIILIVIFVIVGFLLGKGIILLEE